MNREDFAAQVIAELRVRGIESVDFDADRFAVIYRSDVPSTSPWTVYLSNVFAECERDPETRAERVGRFVTSMLTGPDDSASSWSAIRSQLRPVLRGAATSRPHDVPDADLLRRPALPYLDELVVVDQPTSMMYVTATMVSDWGVHEQEVFAAARANLAAIALVPEVAGGDGTPLLRFVDDGDAYWPSHLLVDGWLADVGARLGGQPIALVPEVNTLLITVAHAGVPSLLESAIETYLEAPRDLSPMAYTVDHLGQVVPYTVAAGDPAEPPLRRAERVLAYRQYSAQAERLAEGDPPEEMIGKLRLFGSPDGGAVSMTVWPLFTAALLPRADFVSVVLEGEDMPLLLPWDALVDEGLFAEAVEYRPVRFLTEGCADERITPALRAHAR